MRGLATIWMVALGLVACEADTLPCEAPEASPSQPAWATTEVGAEVATEPASPEPEVAARPEVPPWSCPEGVVCVDALPFFHEADTGLDGEIGLDGYGCAPELDESGPEVLYRIEVAAAGFLSAAVYDGAGVDVDVHILSDLQADACLARGHHGAAVDVAAGIVWVVVDTWSDGIAPLAGEYQVEISLTEPSVGPCHMVAGEMPRVGDGGDHLVMPATGPVVMEAHLVTQEEPEPYPASATEGLADHYALSQAATGLVMHRDQVWAPLEGGAFYGCGIGSPSLFPVEHEAWYVTMYWTASARPDRGTRMILRLPDSDRAVVVAAGYETGPGNLDHIGGAPEEPHLYLGTGHKSPLTLGVADDQDLPFGPRRCTD